MKLVHRMKLLWRAPERMGEQAERIAVLERNLISLANAINDQANGLGTLGGAIIDQAHAIRLIGQAIHADLPGETVLPELARIH